MINSTSIKQPELFATAYTVPPTLQDVLAHTYGLYIVTYNYHWNVEGEKFNHLHTLFERQYNDLFLAVDLIAKRIRDLGDYANLHENVPDAPLSKMIPAELSDEISPDDRAYRMLQNLMNRHGDIVKNCQSSKRVAQNVHDSASECLMIERIASHQKALCVLRDAAR